MRAGTFVVIMLIGVGCGTRGGDGGSRIVDRDAGGSGCLGTTNGPLGPCLCASDCAEPGVCFTEESTGFALGICRINCDLAPCPEGSFCDTSGSVHHCVPTCASTAECGAGRICNSGQCFPFCQSNGECHSGNCNPYSGYCLPAGVVPMGAGINEPCLRYEDCLSTICSDALGVCVSPCVMSTQSCPDGNVCVSNDDSPSEDYGVCWPECRTDGTCATGACIEVPAPPGQRACEPP